jgi:hypothetical protein
MVRMARRRGQAAAPGAVAPAPAESRSISTWLDLLERMIRLPEAVRRDLRQELETHLNDRVRDLVIGGRAESEAVATAIAELGDAAELARGLESARRTAPRRLLMQLSTAGAALTLVGVSIVALNGAEDGARDLDRAVVPAEHYERAVRAERSALPDTRVTADFTEALAADVFAFVGEACDRDVVVHWTELEDHGLGRATAVTLAMRDVPLERALDRIVETIDGGSKTLAWWSEDGVIEISSRVSALRRTIILTSYRIDGIIDAITERYGLEHDGIVAQITSLMYELVESEQWRENGGDLGQVHVVGGTMFVEAPRVMQEEVAWILAQLARSSGVADAAPEPG